MENLFAQTNGAPAFKIHVSARVNSTCTISIPTSTYSTVFTVTANQVYVFTLPQDTLFPQGDEAVSNSGILLLASDSVEVRAFHHRLYFTESTFVLPADELGDEYAVITHTDALNTSPSQLVVLATQNNSTIEITPSKQTLSNRPAGQSFTVLLQQGQLFQVQSMNDLTGTIVKSVDPQVNIAVFAGARQAAVVCGSDDHLYEQSLPLKHLGTLYHVVPYSGHLVDLVKVLATRNNTTLNVTGLGTYALSQGQSISFTVNAACEISANFPLAVSQLATGQSCNGDGPNAIGDGGLINLLAADNRLKETIFYAPDCWSNNTGPLECYPVRRLNLIVNSSAVGTALFDNTVLPASSFSVISPGSNYSYTQLVLDTMSSLQHTITCNRGFNAYLYAFGQFSFYGHHLGFDRTETFDGTGLETVTDVDGVKLYPNPVQTELTIRADQKICGLEVFDLLGNTVMQHSWDATNEVRIDIAALTPGVYSCKITYNEKGKSATIKKIHKL